MLVSVAAKKLRQFHENKAKRSMWIRANTATTNIADEMGRSLLGENEADIYIEDDRSVRLHLQHGSDQLFPVAKQLAS